MSEKEFPKFGKDKVSVHLSKDATPETLKALIDMANHILYKVMICPYCGGDRVIAKLDFTEFFCSNCRRYYRIQDDE